MVRSEIEISTYFLIQCSLRERQVGQLRKIIRATLPAKYPLQHVSSALTQLSTTTRSRRSVGTSGRELTRCCSSAPILMCGAFIQEEVFIPRSLKVDGKVFSTLGRVLSTPRLSYFFSQPK